MALKGDTSNLLLADIFQTLFQSGQSGILHLRGQGEHRVHFSRHGVTLFDAHVFRGERLGHLLVAGGVVKQDAVEAALEEVTRAGPDPFSSVKMLVVLDEEGLLPLAQGTRVLCSEVREELFEIFLDVRMEFEFIDDKIPIESIPRECYFRPEEIVMEAARRIDEWARIEETLGTGDHYFIATEDAQFENGEAVLALLNGRNTLREISEMLLVSRFEVCRIAWLLQEAKHLRFATADELLAAARSTDAPTGAVRIERMLRRALTQLDDRDPRLDDLAECAIKADVRPLAIDILLRRARALLADGHPETALSEAVRARNLDSEHRGVLELLSQLYRVRGERANEVKALTNLAERSATEGKYVVAVEHAARVAELFPDSPLLDQAFVMYCQHAERRQFGAEVLAQAAKRRENPARAALCYQGILLLDSSRHDIRRLLEKMAKKRRSGRLVWLSLGVLMIPVLAIVGKQIVGRFETERISGRFQAIEQLVAAREFKAAQAALQTVEADALDSDSKKRLDEIRTEIDQAMKTEIESQRLDALNNIRSQLSVVQEMLNARRFSDALMALNLAGAGKLQPEQLELVNAKMRVLAGAIDADATNLDKAARGFTVPSEDTELAPALARFGSDFTKDRLADYSRLAETLAAEPPENRFQSEWKKLAQAAERGKQALASVEPGVAEIRSRLERNSSLELLSDDYRDVLEAERTGNFSAAVQGYSRLLREYGDGTLADYFEQKLAAAQKVEKEIEEIRKLSDRGEDDSALERAKKLIDGTTELALARTVGIPQRIDSTPTGAEVMNGERSVGKTPCVLWVKETTNPEDLTYSVKTAGFQPQSIELSPKGPAKITIELAREVGFSTRLDTPIAVAPVASDRYVFVGARDGVLYRLDRRTGGRAGEFRTDSLFGVCAPPLLVGDAVLVPLGEGKVVSIGAETLKQNFVANVGSKIVGAPVLRNGKLMCATERGALAEVDVTSGDVRTIAALEVQLTCGPVFAGDLAAVGDLAGELIILDVRDGSIAARTPKSTQPIVGIASHGSRFVIANDAGVISCHEAADGASAWSFEAGAASGTAPLVKDGLVLFAAGKHVLVIDATTGDRRFDAEAPDWVASTPTISAGRVYACDRSGGLNVFDATTAAKLFRHPLTASTSAVPQVLPEGILIATSDGTITIVGS